MKQFVSEQGDLVLHLAICAAICSLFLFSDMAGGKGMLHVISMCVGEELEERTQVMTSMEEWNILQEVAAIPNPSVERVSDGKLMAEQEYSITDCVTAVEGVSGCVLECQVEKVKRKSDGEDVTELVYDSAGKKLFFSLPGVYTVTAFVMDHNRKYQRVKLDFAVNRG